MPFTYEERTTNVQLRLSATIENHLIQEAFFFPMFKKVVFWCEFPEKVDWKFAERLLRGMPTEVYVAVRDVQEYQHWKRKTKLAVFPWPVLSKEEGYWFSGFTSRKAIDQLKQYKGLKIKIDLEPPLPRWQYSNLRILAYALRKIFQRGENVAYLQQVIYEVAGRGSGTTMKSAALLVNEFPFAKWYLRRQGTYIELKKGMQKNYMCYTSFAGGFFRPLIRMYLKWFMRKAVARDKNVGFSLGLIGHGILGREGSYYRVGEFLEDVAMAEESGCRQIAVYSLDTMLGRKHPQEWVDAIRPFVSQASHQNK